MKEKGSNKYLPSQQSANKEKKDLPGYPLYPVDEDIYKKYQQEKNIDPEDISRVKESTDKDKTGKRNVKNFNEDVSGNDLDIPGFELDDEQEIIGSEDEENNYYSLGGDEHNDLEEDKGL